MSAFPCCCNPEPFPFYQSTNVWLDPTFSCHSSENVKCHLNHNWIVTGNKVHPPKERKATRCRLKCWIFTRMPVHPWIWPNSWRFLGVKYFASLWNLRVLLNFPRNFAIHSLRGAQTPRTTRITWFFKLAIDDFLSPLFLSSDRHRFARHAEKGRSAESMRTFLFLRCHFQHKRRNVAVQMENLALTPVQFRGRSYKMWR